MQCRYLAWWCSALSPAWWQKYLAFWNNAICERLGLPLASLNAPCQLVPCKPPGEQRRDEAPREVAKQEQEMEG